MLATVEDGVEACLHIFLQYVLPTKFPEGLSTEEEWKAFLEYISPNGESLDEEATGAGLVKLVSGRFLERFQIQLSVADGKARFHQIKTDVEKGDLRLLRIAPAAASVFCRKANESEAEYQSRVRKRVTDKHVAESKTTAVGLFDLLLTAIENRFQNEDGFETDSLPKDVIDVLVDIIQGDLSGCYNWLKDANPNLSGIFAKKQFLMFMKRKSCEKNVLFVAGYTLLLFLMSGGKDLLVQFIKKVCSRCRVYFLGERRAIVESD